MISGATVFQTYTSTQKKRRPRSVILFSKLNRMFFGYSDPFDFDFNHTKKFDFRGEGSDMPGEHITANEHGNALYARAHGMGVKANKADRNEGTSTSWHTCWIAADIKRAEEFNGIFFEKATAAWIWSASLVPETSSLH